MFLVSVLIYVKFQWYWKYFTNFTTQYIVQVIAWFVYCNSSYSGGGSLSKSRNSGSSQSSGFGDQKQKSKGNVSNPHNEIETASRNLPKDVSYNIHAHNENNTSDDGHQANNDCDKNIIENDCISQLSTVNSCTISR